MPRDEYLPFHEYCEKQAKRFNQIKKQKSITLKQVNNDDFFKTDHHPDRENRSCLSVVGRLLQYNVLKTTNLEFFDYKAIKSLRKIDHIDKKYDMGYIIDRGDLALVRHATHIELDMPCTIKVISKGLLQDCREEQEQI